MQLINPLEQRNDIRDLGKITDKWTTAATEIIVAIPKSDTENKAV